MHIKGPGATELPVLVNLDHVTHALLTQQGTMKLITSMGEMEVSETYDKVAELIKEPELVEGVSLVDAVWPSCLKDPSAV